jgi:WD40 repeat protein
MGFAEDLNVSPDWRHLILWKDTWEGYFWRVSDGVLLQVLAAGLSPEALEEIRKSNPAFADRLEIGGSVHYDHVSPGQEFLYSWSDADEGILKDLETDELVCTGLEVSQVVTFSPDGSLLAIPSASKVLVLETRGCRIIYELAGHSARVWALAFSPGGVILASGSTDGAIMLWDLAGGSLLTSMRGHSGQLRYYVFQALVSDISGLAFSPDGRYLASGGWRDGTIRIWGVVP